MDWLKKIFNLQNIAPIFIWLIIFATCIFFFYFKSIFLSIKEIIISLVPSIVFLFGTIIIYSRDKKIVKKAEENGVLTSSREINWRQSLKHDFLTYFIPFIIIVLPFFFDQKPGLIDIAQAIVVFLALTYLKFMYWGEI